LLLGRKLEHFKVRDISLLWFKNYLLNRRQYVHSRETESKMFDVTCGVPQGSILGPLQCSCYI